QVIHFKRGVYRRALQELVPELPLQQGLIIPEQNNHLLME
ncbi:MAG TPA: RNA pyrophosphohydrolase, partial [Psychrobacter sp.]|nr:RNA pyrophosphohydrolase [Psychrobacter sp.]